jgi:Competence protein
MQKAILNKEPILALDIDTPNEENIKEYSKNNKLSCPYCGETLIFRSGNEKISHFAHKIANPDCFYSKFQSADTSLFEEAQSDLLSRLRFLHPNIDFDIAVKEADTFFDIVGHSLGFEIKIKLFTEFQSLQKYKGNCLKILVSKGDRLTMPFEQFIEDVLAYSIHEKAFYLFKVNNMPFEIFRGRCGLDQACINADNTISTKEFKGNAKVYPLDRSKKSKTKTSSYDTQVGFDTSPNPANATANEEPIKQSFNEMYPNLYMYLLDIENGKTIDQAEIINKLSYYLILLYNDRTVFFKYSPYLRADRFYNSDYFAVLKKKFAIIEKKNPKLTGTLDMILEKADKQ